MGVRALWFALLFVIIAAVAVLEHRLPAAAGSLIGQSFWHISDLTTALMTFAEDAAGRTAAYIRWNHLLAKGGSAVSRAAVLLWTTRSWFC
jgi:hypothetical protein